MNIRFYLASAGNCFMAEIARMLAEGFLALGHEASLEFDADPPSRPRQGFLNVLVAPHEIFPLFLRSRHRRRDLVRTAANCYCLNTEQPGSRWFEAAFHFASRSKGVFDINRQGVREFQLRGVPAAYVPLGYAPSLEANCEVKKDLDILFLGHSSPKRERFLARHAGGAFTLRLPADPCRCRAAAECGDARFLRRRRTESARTAVADPAQSPFQQPYLFRVAPRAYGRGQPLPVRFRNQ